jgi:hypothetical protein
VAAPSCYASTPAPSLGSRGVGADAPELQPQEARPGFGGSTPAAQRGGSSKAVARGLVRPQRSKAVARVVVRRRRSKGAVRRCGDLEQGGGAAPEELGVADGGARRRWRSLDLPMGELADAPDLAGPRRP